MDDEGKRSGSKHNAAECNLCEAHSMAEDLRSQCSALEEACTSKDQEILALSKRLTAVTESLERKIRGLESQLSDVLKEYENEILLLRVMSADAEGRLVQQRNAAIRASQLLEKERDARRVAQDDLSDCNKRLASARRLLDATPITVGADALETILSELLGSSPPEHCTMESMSELLDNHEWAGFIQLLSLWLSTGHRG